METKKELRKRILNLRDELTLQQRKESSAVILKQVMDLPEFHNAEIILLYASYKSEVDTKEMIKTFLKMGKHVYVPKVKEAEIEFYQICGLDDLIEGYQGIPEPKEMPERLFVHEKSAPICALIPGVVFDEEGNRMGYGKGFYDRFLHRMKESAICKVAVAFQCQMVKNGTIPAEKHDVKMDKIITEKGLTNLTSVSII